MRFLKSLLSRLNLDQFVLRISILFLISLQSVMVNAQDTLIYNSGKTEVVEIISLSNEQQLLKYVLNEDTVVRTFSSISEFKIYSKDVDSIILNPGKSSATSLIDQDFRREKRRNNSFTQPSTYKYSGFSVGLNTLTFLSGFQLLESQVASNAHLSLYGEFRFNKHFGIRISNRIGLSLIDTSKSWVPSNSKLRIQKQNEIIFELGFEPTIYINKHNTVNLYAKPGFQVGKNHEILSTYYDDYFNYPQYVEIDTSKYIRTTTNKIGDTRWYYRVSLCLGLEINLLKNLSFGLETGLYFGNNIQVHWNRYYNTQSSENYIWGGEGSYSSPFDHAPLQLQGAINLIYRIGGKVRSSTDEG